MKPITKPDLIPKLTVLMSCYNDGEFLAEAIESILNQTLKDFEFLIINDGSTDSSLQIIESYASKDSRIRIINNEKNCGLINSLNNGLQLASCELIARMDADDFAFPERLQCQYDYMCTHPEVVLCGGIMTCYENPQKILTCVESHTDIVIAFLFFDNPICHPSVVYRKSVILAAGGYDAEDVYSGDCGLWIKLITENRGKLVNLPKVFIKYRIHPTIDRVEYKRIQAQTALNKYLLIFDYFDIKYDRTFFEQLRNRKRWHLSEVITFEAIMQQVQDRLIGSDSYDKFLQKKTRAIMIARRRVLLESLPAIKMMLSAKLYYTKRKISKIRHYIKNKYMQK